LRVVELQVDILLTVAQRVLQVAF